MGLIDRMRDQATQLAGKAQEAGKAGQAKLDALQARRRADAVLRELGLIAYAAQAGRGTAGDEARTATLVGQLRDYESEYGSLTDADPEPEA